MFIRTKNNKWKKKDEAIKNANPYKNWTGVTEFKRSLFVHKNQKPKSKKETEVIDILNGLRIRFYKEVSFDFKTRFDFYIPLIDTVIELDGWQHFHYLHLMERDRLKDEFCKKHKIRLIRYNKNHNLLECIKNDLLKP